MGSHPARPCMPGILAPATERRHTRGMSQANRGRPALPVLGAAG